MNRAKSFIHHHSETIFTLVSQDTPTHWISQLSRVNKHDDLYVPLVYDDHINLSPAPLLHIQAKVCVEPVKRTQIKRNADDGKAQDSNSNITTYISTS